MTPEDVLTACAYSSSQTPYETHFHNAHEIVYVQAGRAQFQIGGSRYEAGPHSVIFIGRLEEHSVQILEKNYLRYYARFSPAQLDRLLDEPRLRSAFVSRPAGFCHCMDVSPAARQVEEPFARIAEEFARPGPLGGRYLAALFTQMMIACYRIGKEQFPQPDRNAGAAVLEAQRFIDRHFMEDIALEELARRFCISPSYLSHTFRAWTGYSPKQYIVLSRISCAKALLKATPLSVTETAAKCGFGDVNNFIRSFKKQTGLTPGCYRKAGDAV